MNTTTAVRNDEFDDPNQVDSVELKIMAATGNSNPEIYANGRHQLPVEIMALAKKIDEKTGEEKILNFSEAQWIHLINLRLAESDQLLNFNGTSGWCFATRKNEFSGEIVQRGVRSSGSTFIIMYVSTFNSGTERIAVSFDTDNGKHFTTADNASGAEKMSLSVTALNEIIYCKDDLDFQVAYAASSEQKTYYNYYIGLRNKFKIQQSQLHGEFPKSGAEKWCTWYTIEKNKDIHFILVAHPFSSTGGQTRDFGFNVHSYHNGSADLRGEVKLTQTVTYNTRRNQICLTVLVFDMSPAVFRPADHEIKKGYMKRKAVPFFRPEPWFDLHDQYGNYGKFDFKFEEDRTLVVTNRE